MGKLDEIKKTFGGPICRDCINYLYKVHLYPKDCLYNGETLRKCYHCGRMKHLVLGLNSSGKLKLTFKNMRE